MEHSVDESWDRILAWLAENAPDALARIGPPAAAAELAEAEAALGVALPAGLLAWWRRANGADRPWHGRPFDLLPGYCPVPIEMALDTRRILLEIAEADECDADEIAELEAQPAGSWCDTWLAPWMPIATSQGGQELFVDLRQGPLHGCVREYDKVGAAESAPRWTDVGAMLTDIAGALEQGTEISGLYAGHVEVTRDGSLCWRGPD
ncbi:SMI1/KNR4 family protein [Actinomadura fulvescens]|uniref:Knr4/Smi1-like domain-containing protein n=1 Tax=Actinomadura fulvescens TaxID=46160 RepID=A0ABP6DFC4_9ACTN